MPAASRSYGFDPHLVALGQAIKRSRMARGLSQEALAGLSEIDRSYMSSIERGGQNPGVMSIMRICRAMEMSLADLMLEARL